MQVDNLRSGPAATEAVDSGSVPETSGLIPRDEHVEVSSASQGNSMGVEGREPGPVVARGSGQASQVDDMREKFVQKI